MLLLAVHAAALAAAAPRRPLLDDAFATIHGAGFAGGPMATPHAPLGGAASNASLTALAATGASQMQLYSTCKDASNPPLPVLSWLFSERMLVLTGYQGLQGLAATSIAPYRSGSGSGSPLRSESDGELLATMAAAGSLNMGAILSPRLDLNWDTLTDAAVTPTSNPRWLLVPNLNVSDSLRFSFSFVLCSRSTRALRALGGDSASLSGIRGLHLTPISFSTTRRCDASPRFEAIRGGSFG